MGLLSGFFKSLQSFLSVLICSFFLPEYVSLDLDPQGNSKVTIFSIMFTCSDSGIGICTWICGSWYVACYRVFHGLEFSWYRCQDEGLRQLHPVSRIWEPVFNFWCHVLTSGSYRCSPWGKTRMTKKMGSWFPSGTPGLSFKLLASARNNSNTPALASTSNCHLLI